MMKMNFAEEAYMDIVWLVTTDPASIMWFGLYCVSYDGYDNEYVVGKHLESWTKSFDYLKDAVKFVKDEIVKSKGESDAE